MSTLDPPARGQATIDGVEDVRAFVPRGSLRWIQDEPDVRHRQVEGSLVFVDIAGFTAMSERLARLGPVGAEEVTDLLNQTFSRLLAVAYEDDGSLVKFGGDALLLQFEGPQHCLRAVHAAQGMRRRLRELQPLTSSAGQVRLRMSIGVHSGPIDQFLVGTQHRELLLAGPGVSTVVAMEGAAGANEILLSPAVVANLGDRIRTTAATVGFRLRSDVPLPSTVPQPDSTPATAAGASLLSPSVRARLRSGTPESEHRAAVVGFLRFRGTDRLLAVDGPGATAAALEQLVDLVDDALTPEEVCLLTTDVDVDGGKFVLCAGVPTATEFDGERMLRALRRIVEQPLPLDVTIGVHAGPVFAGVVGPWFRLTYTIIGDAVNLAARVMGRASPGTVLATPEVLNRSQALFTTAPVPAFRVKGKKQPVQAYEVGPVTTERSRRPTARFRLAGRQAELQQLLDEFDAAEAGPGRVVQLVGPAGLGKTRLVDESHERRPHFHRVTGACNRYESTTPYHVVSQLLRTVLELPARAGTDDLERAVTQRAPGLVASLPLLGDAMGVPVADTEATRELTSRFRAERVVAAVCDLFEAALPEPSAIVIEDVHWIDPESSRVLDALTRSSLPGRRWVLVVTARRALAQASPADLDSTAITLRPLGTAESRELVLAAVEEGLVTIEQGHRLSERAGGNPFFLQELLRTRRVEGELPADVDALIQSELDQLPPHDREMLGYAAVLGAEVEPELFEAVTGIGHADQAAVWSRLDGFVEPSGADRFQFRHVLAHDAAYARLPFRRRRDLHLRAAEALERREDDQRFDLLALHTFHGRDWDRAHRYAIAAGELAQARFANLTAAEQYRHAVESARFVRGLSPQQVADVWERLGDALMLASAYDDAVTAYRRAKQLADPARQVHLCDQIGQLRERQGRYSEALRWFTRGRTLDATAQTGETPRLLLESAIVRIRQGRADDALALAQQSSPAVDDSRTRARVHYVRAWAAMLRGEDGRDDQRRTLELFREADDLIGQGLAYNVISMAAYHRGDWDEAARAYEHAGVLRRRVGDEVAAAVATGNLGELLADQGHFGRATPLLEEARAVCAATGYQVGQCFATMTLGRLAARQGRYDAALADLTLALEQLQRVGAAALVRDAHLRLAELALFRGDHGTALAEAEVLDASAEVGGGPGLRAVGQRIRTCVLLETGDAEAARVAGEQLLAALDEADTDYDTALALVVVATTLEAGDDPRAPTVRSRADRLLTRLGVVVPAELLVFGPTSERTTRALTAWGDPVDDYLSLLPPDALTSK